MKEKISIIIPIFNTEKYLEECINSVLCQTYKNLEILLINDGSTDKSLLICEKYKKIDDRIKLYSKKNGGLSDARNYGIEKAKGDFIFFLDSDDIIQKNTIEIMSKYLENDSTMVICDFDRFTNKVSDCNGRIANHKYSRKQYFKSILKLRNNTYAWGCLIPKKIIKNDRFIVGRYFEDMSFMYNLYHRCSNIIKLDTKLYKYRNNSNSIIHTINNKKINDYISSAKEMISFIEENYAFEIKDINTFMAYVYRECYILSRNIDYLKEATKKAKKSNLNGLSIKNKIKIILLRSKTLTKLIVDIKNR